MQLEKGNVVTAMKQLTFSPLFNIRNSMLTFQFSLQWKEQHSINCWLLPAPTCQLSDSCNGQESSTRDLWGPWRTKHLVIACGFNFTLQGIYTLGKDLISGTICLWYYGCGCCCLIYCPCHAVGMSAKLERICSVIIWMQIITSVWTLYNCVSHMTVDYVWNTDMQVSVEVCFCILFLSETLQSYSLWALLSGNPR